MGLVVDHDSDDQIRKGLVMVEMIRWVIESMDYHRCILLLLIMIFLYVELAS